MFPALYDAALAPLERLGLRRWRAELLAQARGDVLEIGGGTGLNLPHYRPDVRLVLTEYDRAMLDRARRRHGPAPGSIALVAADAMRLPCADTRFDTVVATLTFCTIPDPRRAFAEVTRVLRPGGIVLLLEHVRTPRAPVARLQDWMTPLWKHLAHGCHLNRQPLELARAQGFKIETLHPGLDGWLIAARLVRPTTG
jgi:ubiquinone/menaquinone biosynthesis C-methylase UbiE